MKIKIIKRAATKKIVEEIPVTGNDRKTDTRRAIETVKFRIADLRQKREREYLSPEEFFSREPCI